MYSTTVRRTVAADSCSGGYVELVPGGRVVEPVESGCRPTRMGWDRGWPWQRWPDWLALLIGWAS